MTNMQTPNPQQVATLKIHLARQSMEYVTTVDRPTPESIAKNIAFIIRRDGVWEMRKNKVGVFYRLRAKFDEPLPGFPEETNREHATLNHGKIPFALFEQIQAFFKKICDESKDEAYVQTFWNPETNEYFNHVPKQRISGASVNFERNTELESRCVLVLETHSHNTMGAFFSGTDNNDEKSDRFFGVIGKLNSMNPEMKFSYVCGGKRIEVARGDVFDEPSSAVSFPAEWEGQIEKGYHRAVLAENTTGRSALSYESSQEDIFAAYQAENRGHWSAQKSHHSEIEDIIDRARREHDQKKTPDSDEDEGLVRACGVLIQKKIEGERMDNFQKHRLFTNIAQNMDEKDVEILVKCLLKQGFEDVLWTVLPTVTTPDGIVVDEIEDPFLSE